MADERAVAGALMADGHLGYSMPIGGVVAYENAISPTGVGFDIGCGNMAVKTNILAHGDLRLGRDLKPIMRQIQKTVAFGMGRSREDVMDDWILDHPLWASETWKELDKHFRDKLWVKARAQLGTVGSGNHYVDLLVDDEDYIWVANHFGSRGLGHGIAQGFFAAEAGLNMTDKVPEGEAPVVLDLGTYLGDFYVEAMTLAGEYAYAGREYVMRQVLGILGAEAVETVHNHHNYAWLENGLWVVRKGATPLNGLPAYIGGSMGDASAIVRGIGDFTRIPGGPCESVGCGGTWRVNDIGNLGSAPHGAGRVMSRTAAAGKLRKMWYCRDCGFQARAMGNPDGSPSTPPQHEHKLQKVQMRDKTTAAIDWDAVRGGLNMRGVVVLGAGADESPGVYKRLPEVLAAHKNIEVLNWLDPIGVVMAGPDEFDPYKD